MSFDIGDRVEVTNSGHKIAVGTIVDIGSDEERWHYVALDDCDSCTHISENGHLCCDGWHDNVLKLVQKRPYNKNYDNDAQRLKDWLGV